MLERFADRSRLQAGSLVAFGLAVPLALPLGVAAAALTTLRRGLVDGTVVCAGALGVVGALLAAGGGSPAGLLWLGLVLAAALSMADVLRRTASLNLAVQTGIGIALLGLLAALLSLPDPVARWRGLLARSLARMAAGGGGLAPQEQERLLDALPLEAMTGLVISGLLVFAWLGLFLGRSWQARLGNPGGFRREFHALALGKVLALASAAAFVAYALLPQVWLLNVSALLMHVWVLQGIAYLHWTVAQAGGGLPWLVLSYGVLAFFWITTNPLAIGVPLVGLAGELVGYRRHVGRWIERGRGRGD